MSDTPYEKECIYCHDKIRMSKETGKWLPYNKDGSDHDCRTKDKEERKQEATLQDVLKKLESNGIIINVDRLMAQK